MCQAVTEFTDRSPERAAYSGDSCHPFHVKANGESAEKMAFSEVVDGKFRFMKAQGVQAVCMNCHAAEIKPETEAALREKYPLDKARGYTLGQIRGAFSLSRDL